MVTIRPATVEDLPAILDIYNDIIATSTAVYHYNPVDLADRRAWYDARIAAGYPVLVALAGDTIVGFSTFGDWRGSWPGYQYTVEHSVHLHRDYRGQGIGGELVEALFPYARAMQKHVMIAAIDADNKGSIRFHERLGFESVAHFREIGYKFGRWLDSVWMQKMLDEPGAPRDNS